MHGEKGDINDIVHLCCLSLVTLFLGGLVTNSDNRGK